LLTCNSSATVQPAKNPRTSGPDPYRLRATNITAFSFVSNSLLYASYPQRFRPLIFSIFTTSARSSSAISSIAYGLTNGHISRYCESLNDTLLLPRIKYECEPDSIQAYTFGLRPSGFTPDFSAQQSPGQFDFGFGRAHVTGPQGLRVYCFPSPVFQERQSRHMISRKF